ncbi:MAG TPA: hypothetical protein VNT81_19825 [Vicinamibacterales bacterium]|nr:hypothetical protein [Vicinamibacterales bacterium]
MKDSARRRDHRFYIGVTLFLIATVVVGFWQSYFGTLLTGGIARPMVMHLHGAVFTGWMVLLLVQVGLAASGRVGMHRRVGNFGIWYGVLVWMMGVVATFAAPVLHVSAGEWTLDQAAGFLIFPIGDMILFAGFFGAAVAYRNKPDMHKRWMLAATVALAFAAVARLNLPLHWFALLWLSPMFASMTYELIARGRVHKVDAGATVIMAIAFPRIFLERSESWIAVGRVLLQPFL